jgi:hypothetical protein
MANIIIHSATPILPAPPLIEVQLFPSRTCMAHKNNASESLDEWNANRGVLPYTETGGLSWTAKKSSIKSCLVFNYELRVCFLQCCPIIAWFCYRSQENSLKLTDICGWHIMHVKKERVEKWSQEKYQLDPHPLDPPDPSVYTICNQFEFTEFKIFVRKLSQNFILSVLRDFFTRWYIFKIDFMLLNCRKGFWGYFWAFSYIVGGKSCLIS